MKIILLDIPQSEKTHLVSNSILRSYPKIKYFYFMIRKELNHIDQAHLIRQGKSFFSSQFTISIDLNLSILDRTFLKDKSLAHELSWEIFYKFNSWIKVISGIYDEDLDWFISGFSGKIINFFSDGTQNIFQIAYSGKSLNQIPGKHILSLPKNNSPLFTFLESDIIMPDDPPKNIIKDQLYLLNTIKEISNYLVLFPEKGSTENKIKNIIDLLTTWEKIFLQSFMNHPSIKVKTINDKEFLWEGIHNSDDMYGIWGLFSKNQSQFIFPLTEISHVIDNQELSTKLQKYIELAKLILPN